MDRRQFLYTSGIAAASTLLTPDSLFAKSNPKTYLNLKDVVDALPVYTVRHVDRIIDRDGAEHYGRTVSRKYNRAPYDLMQIANYPLGQKSSIEEMRNTIVHEFTHIKNWEKHDGKSENEVRALADEITDHIYSTTSGIKERYKRTGKLDLELRDFIDALCEVDVEHDVYKPFIVNGKKKAIMGTYDPNKRRISIVTNIRRKDIIRQEIFHEFLHWAEDAIGAQFPDAEIVRMTTANYERIY